FFALGLGRNRRSRRQPSSCHTCQHSHQPPKRLAPRPRDSHSPASRPAQTISHQHCANAHPPDPSSKGKGQPVSSPVGLFCFSSSVLLRTALSFTALCALVRPEIDAQLSWLFLTPGAATDAVPDPPRRPLRAGPC